MSPNQFVVFYNDDGEKDDLRMFDSFDTLKEAIECCEGFSSDTYVWIYKRAKAGEVKSVVEWEDK